MGIENGSQCFNSLESVLQTIHLSIPVGENDVTSHVAWRVQCSQQSTVNMAPKRYKRSKFGYTSLKKDENRATCNTCKVDITSKGGNTTNMQKHLLTQHAKTINPLTPEFI